MSDTKEPTQAELAAIAAEIHAAHEDTTNAVALLDTAIHNIWQQRQRIAKLEQDRDYWQGKAFAAQLQRIAGLMGGDDNE